MPEPLRILFITSEVHPFSKTGGLADVSSALPRFLARAGHDVRVVTPLYAAARDGVREFVPEESASGVPVRFGGATATFSAATAMLPGTDLAVRFVDCPPLYDRPGLYGSGPDESMRFALLARAALELCRRWGWSPNVVHCHDWHTALAPIYLKTLHAGDTLFRATRTVLTIHNVGYQGVFPASVVADLGLAASARLLHAPDLREGRFSFLKTGILHADVLTTVSRTYALEIQTEEYAPGLHELLRARRGSLVGIVNGVDYDEWDPALDRHIPVRYDASSLEGKAECRRELLRSLGLGDEPGAAVVGVVSRLTAQKGFELCFETLPELLQRRDFRLAVLGSGESRLEEFFSRLQTAFPGRVCFWRGFNEALAHLIEAGSDMFLMPSRYEPCGLNQMYSLKYGTVPVVRRTGGLADTVEPWDPSAGTGTGFVFEHFTAEGLRWALERALEAFADRESWRRLVLNGMSRDFSWDVQGRHYVSLYSELAAG